MQQIAGNKYTALPWRFIQILDHFREGFALSALWISDCTRIMQRLLCHRISKLSEKELAAERICERIHAEIGKINGNAVQMNNINDDPIAAMLTKMAPRRIRKEGWIV